MEKIVFRWALMPAAYYAAAIVILTQVIAVTVTALAGNAGRILLIVCLIAGFVQAAPFALLMGYVAVFSMAVYLIIAFLIDLYNNKL